MSRLAPILDAYFGTSGNQPIHFFLEVEDADSWQDLSTLLVTEEADLGIRHSRDSLDMQIHIPKSFRKLFMVPENTAERALVECLINSSSTALGI